MLSRARAPDCGEGRTLLSVSERCNRVGYLDPSRSSSLVPLVHPVMHTAEAVIDRAVPEALDHRLGRQLPDGSCSGTAHRPHAGSAPQYGRRKRMDAVQRVNSERRGQKGRAAARLSACVGLIESLQRTGFRRPWLAGERLQRFLRLRVAVPIGRWPLCGRERCSAPSASKGSRLRPEDRQLRPPSRLAETAS